MHPLFRYDGDGGNPVSLTRFIDKFVSFIEQVLMSGHQTIDSASVRA